MSSALRLIVFALPSLLLLRAVGGCQYARIEGPADELAERSSSETRPAGEPPGMGVGGGPRAFDATMERTVQARCKREERCHKIGRGRVYAAFDDCVANIAVLHPEDFPGVLCDEPVLPEALATCLAEIEADVCAPEDLASLEHALVEHERALAITFDHGAGVICAGDDDTRRGIHATQGEEHLSASFPTWSANECRPSCATC